MTKKLAVVTGAAGGMGGAIVTQLLSQNMDVAAIDIDGASLARFDPGDNSDHFFPEQADLTDPDAVQALFAKLGERHGGIDVLVNNAGTCLMGEFPEIDAHEFNRQMAINFSSAFYCCQNAIPLMKGRAGVRKIINISSNGAYNFDVFDPPHYRASKAALDNLTKDLARRYATERIAVNSIAPAMTETPLFGVLSQNVLARAIEQMPHGHAMKPEQIAAWVGFLASEAGDVSSGNVIILNQGRDVR